MPKRQLTATHNNALDQEGFRSVWTAAPASIVDGKISPSRNKARGLSTPPYRVLQGDVKGQPYTPTTHSELPGMIAKLHRGSEREIIKFASDYGPLGHPQLVRGTAEFVGGDPLPWVLTHSRTLDFVLRAVNMMSLQGSKTYIGAPPEEYPRVLQILTPPADKHLFYEPWVKWVHPVRPSHPLLSDPRNRKADVMWPTVTGYRGYIKVQHWNIAGPPFLWMEILRLIVRDTVNANISGIVHALAPDEPRRDRLALQFSALIEVAYWHVAKAISGGRVAKCEAPGCDSVFIQEDGRQRFCPTGPEKRESPCAIRARVAELRRRRKEERAQQGAGDGTKRRKRSRAV